MKKVLFITNIPTPYRSLFFEKLSNYVDLTVIYEDSIIRGLEFNHSSITPSYKLNIVNNHKLKKLGSFFIITKLIIFSEFDHLFLTNYANLIEIYTYLICVIFKKKYIIEIDGAVIKIKESFFKRGLKKIIFNNATMIFSPSISSDKYFESYGVKKSMIIRYPFTSIEYSDIKQSPKVLRDAKPKIKLLYVSRIIKEKGIETLINAYNDYCHNQRGAITELILIGNAPDDNYLKFIKSNMNSSTTYKGFLTKSELMDYYDSSDIFIFPSHGDIWGLVLNEAMARGLPIICSDKVNAASELIEEGVNGLIYNSENKQELLKLIEFLISNKALRISMSINNIKKIKKYTIENMVNVHIEALSEF